MEEKNKPMPVIIDAEVYTTLKRISEKDGVRIRWMVNKAVAEWLTKRPVAEQA